MVLRMPRIKAYQQLEHSDCGITCVRIIARYYGQVIPLKHLREICDVSRVGISLRDIRTCTQQIGFKSEVVRLSMDEVKRMPLPAILYWNQRHYVVLYKVGHGTKDFYIADPARGKVKIGYDEFQRQWIPSGGHGLAVVMDPTEDFYSKKYEREEGWSRGLWRMLRRVAGENRRTFGMVVAMTLLAMVADIATPVLFQRTIDDGINGHDVSLVWMLIAAQFAIFLGNYASNCITEIMLVKAGLRMSISLMNEYLGKLVRLPVAFFDRKVNSDFIQKLDDENRIKNFLLSMPQTIVFTLVNLFVFSAMLIYYSPNVFSIFVGGTLLASGWVQFHLRRRKALITLISRVLQKTAIMCMNL